MFIYFVLWLILTCRLGLTKCECCAEARSYACKILSADISLAAEHPSRVKDNAFAKNNIKDMCDGNEASRSQYNCSECRDPGAPGGKVCLDSKLLRYIYDLGTSFPKKIHITEIAGACHSCNSKHYNGVAVDIRCDERHFTKDCDHSAGKNPEIIDMCRNKYGGIAINHTTHIHCQVVPNGMCNINSGQYITDNNLCISSVLLLWFMFRMLY